jgi:hypothetical protein
MPFLIGTAILAALIALMWCWVSLAEWMEER